MDLINGSADARGPASSLTPMLKKLQLWKSFSNDECTALLGLPYHVKDIPDHGYIVREGQKATHSCLLLSGFAYRQKVTRSGGRSISALHMRGDIVDLQNSLLVTADHSVQALGQARIARIPREAIVELAFAYPNIGMAMWYDTLVDGSIFREWILNNARRNAESAIAHVLCEFGVRLEMLGLGDRCAYEFPFTQDQLADVTGHTAVHVNRSLRKLEDRGLISRNAREIRVGDWPSLKHLAEFDERYLHLQAAESFDCSAERSGADNPL